MRFRTEMWTLPPLSGVLGPTVYNYPFPAPYQKGSDYSCNSVGEFIHIYIYIYIYIYVIQ